MATRAEIAARSSSIRNAINKIAAAFDIEPSHNTTPSRDLDATIRRAVRMLDDAQKRALRAEEGCRAARDALSSLEQQRLSYEALQRDLDEAVAIARDYQGKITLLEDVLADLRAMADLEAEEEIRDLCQQLEQTLEERGRFRHELRLQIKANESLQSRIGNLERENQDLVQQVALLSARLEGGRKRKSRGWWFGWRPDPSSPGRSLVN